MTGNGQFIIDKSGIDFHIIVNHQLPIANKKLKLMKRIILSAVMFIAFMMTANAQHFALVDMEYILKQIPAYEQANQQLETLSKQYQDKIEAQNAEAKKLYESYQKEAATLTDTQKTEREEAIVAKEKATAELRKTYFGPDGEIMKKRQELISPIQDAIYNAIKEVATQQGYDVVFDRASSQNMIFASPRIDISNEILSKLGYSN